MPILIQWLPSACFLSLPSQTNTISGDDKHSVRQLYHALEKAIPKINLPAKVYAIVDRDADDAVSRSVSTARIFTWDAYHIENYLLEPSFIGKVLRDNPHFANPMTDGEIENALRSSAKETLGPLLSHKLISHVNEILRRSLDLRTNRNASDNITELSAAIDRLHLRLGEKVAAELSQDRLKDLKNGWENELTAALGNGAWRTEFRGRDILKHFAGKFLRGLPYEAFRDSIVARMSDAGFRPSGMEAVVDKILKDI